MVACWAAVAVGVVVAAFAVGSLFFERMFVLMMMMMMMMNGDAEQTPEPRKRRRIEWQQQQRPPKKRSSVDGSPFCRINLSELCRLWQMTSWGK